MDKSHTLRDNIEILIEKAPSNKVQLGLIERAAFDAI